MSNLDMQDNASSELFIAEQLAKQLLINHMDIHVKDENNMTSGEQSDYARLFTCNSTLIDIIFDKIKRAKQLIDKMAV